MQFGFLTSQEAEQLEENQKQLKSLMKLSRGKVFSKWKYGEMRAMGSRQPVGGRPGDGYGPYDGVSATSVNDIETLFSHVSVGVIFLQIAVWGHCKNSLQPHLHFFFEQDIECIVAKLEPYAPHVVKSLRELGHRANVLGTYGITAYHCWNYIAPQHYDDDATWTVSYQLRKNNCQEDEFSFALTKWGCYLATVENCCW